MPKRKKIRLPPPAYRVRGRAFSITLGISPRRAVFSDIDLGLECVRALSELSSKAGVLVYAYCLMPDHVHLLIGTAAGFDIALFVGQWKIDLRANPSEKRRLTLFLATQLLRPRDSGDGGLDAHCSIHPRKPRESAVGQRLS